MGPSTPQVIGRYGIYGKIASGGMASVHFGRLLGAVGFSRTVAIKRLHPHLAEDPEFVSTMIDEARLAARIHHPNVVPTLDVVSAMGELLVVMEYVRGESLARLFRAETERDRRIPLPLVSAIITGALHGLHAAHEARSDKGAPLGIVHRDVSPQNILVGVDGLARIIDFGVAKAAGRLQTTRDGVIKGKMAYMAPEQLMASEARRAVDIYAMGVVLWEMLAGRRLFTSESEGQLVALALAGVKVAPSAHAPGLPPELDALVMKALATEPAKRFGSAEEMAEALRRTVPPAFSTDVGRWVEDAAREALRGREAALAEIESGSRMATLPPGAAEPPTRVEGSAPQGEPVSQEVDLSALDRRSSRPPHLATSSSTKEPASSWSRSWWAWAAMALGVGVFSSVGAVALGKKPPSGVAGPAVAAASAAPSSSSSSAARLAPSVTEPVSSDSINSAPPPPPVEATAPIQARPAASTPHAPAGKPRPPAKPSAPIRFAQPD
jgi:serine/threonine-protein kinase